VLNYEQSQVEKRHRGILLPSKLGVRKKGLVQNDEKRKGVNRRNYEKTVPESVKSNL